MTSTTCLSPSSVTGVRCERGRWKRGNFRGQDRWKQGTFQGGDAKGGWCRTDADSNRGLLRRSFERRGDPIVGVSLGAPGMARPADRRAVTVRRKPSGK